MKIEIMTNEIIINNPTTFVARHILDSGQVFRYRDCGNCYELISTDKRCLIYSEENKVRIVTDNPDYYYNYFDLDTDYEVIIEELNNNFNLIDATLYGRGIRMLRQDPLETIINFIISSNNNIPRIKGIINRICASIGSNMGDYYAFPTLEQLAKADKEFYNSIGAGYRGEYLYRTVQAIFNGYDINIICNMNTEGARKYLMGLCGIGPKVADCILLFAYHRMDVFPVDTWIAKVYQDECKLCSNQKIMSNYLCSKYGNLAGYAQQYLFYYKREGKKY